MLASSTHFLSSHAAHSRHFGFLKKDRGDVQGENANAKYHNQYIIVVKTRYKITRLWIFHFVRADKRRRIEQSMQHTTDTVYYFCGITYGTIYHITITSMVVCTICHAGRSNNDFVYIMYIYDAFRNRSFFVCRATQTVPGGWRCGVSSRFLFFTVSSEYYCLVAPTRGTDERPRVHD